MIVFMILVFIGFDICAISTRNINHATIINTSSATGIPVLTGVQTFLIEYIL
jgi:hypothetical protein